MLTDESVGVKIHAGIGDTLTTAIGAKYTSDGPGYEVRSGKPIWEWVNLLTIHGSSELSDHVEFTEITPSTRFPAGDAIAVYQYLKWLKGGQCHSPCSSTQHLLDKCSEWGLYYYFTGYYDEGEGIYMRKAEQAAKE